MYLVFVIVGMYLLFVYPHIVLGGIERREEPFPLLFENVFILHKNITPLVSKVMYFNQRALIFYVLTFVRPKGRGKYINVQMYVHNLRVISYFDEECLE